MEVELAVNSLDETTALGRYLGEHLLPGAVVGLYGPLGVGKTELVRGIALGLGVQDEVSSASFVLEAIYEVPAQEKPVVALHHWDFYRISTADFECDLRDSAADPDRVTVIEWPERVPWSEGLLDLRILLNFVDLGSAPDSGRRRVVLSERGRASLIGGGLGELREQPDKPRNSQL